LSFGHLFPGLDTDKQSAAVKIHKVFIKGEGSFRFEDFYLKKQPQKGGGNRPPPFRLNG
jgi:hypothetical protein